MNAPTFADRSRLRHRVSPLHAALWQLVVVVLAGAIFPAAADDGKQRYVSGAGRDQGDCLNRYRPCRTIGYAISQAGKSDTIQVAEGNYAIEDSRQLLDVVSANGRIAAGFSKYSGYSERNASAQTVLVGVPPEFRERFESAGFTVIVDSKGLDVSREESQQMRKLTAQIVASEQSQAAAPCTSNVSAGFACQSVSLLSHLSLQDLRPAGTRGNDVWGFTDLNTGREYVFMGLENGVSVVDISNPEAPEQVGTPTGTSTTWRDITVYQMYDASERRWRAYAYVSADRVNDPLLVIDLSRLPNGVERIDYNSDFRAAHNIYLVNADYTYGIALSTKTPELGLAGANLNTGNYRLYSLNNPRTPGLLNVATRGYAHEIVSFPVRDARKNQCADPSQPQCQVLTDFNEQTVDMWDVTNASSPRLLASTPYTNAAYVHSGWWTEDGNYVLVHDELDEQNFGLNTTVRVFDVRSLTAPLLVGAWVGPTRAIDHNGAVKGNRYYVSNYSEGLTVLDLSNPAAPTRVGYFDTFPASSQTSFVGAWGVYPFFNSGTVAISDINTGLYLVRDETLASAGGQLSMNSTALSGAEGQAITVTVNRTGGIVGAVSVDLEALYATAGAADGSLATTSLTWANGDAQSKTATLNVVADGQTEDLELLLVRLKNPQGGATLGFANTTHVTIADAAAPAANLRFLDGSPTVDDSRGKALITVTRHGALGAARVNFRTIGTASFPGFTATQGELTWADGEAASKTIAVTVNPATLTAGQNGTFQVELFNATGVELQSSNGASTTSLMATVNVVDSTAQTPSPPSTPSTPRSGGGGGSFGLLLLLALLPLQKRYRACSSSVRGCPRIHCELV